MGTTRFRHALMLAIALLAGSGVAASAQVAAPARTALPGSPPLDSATLAANRRIDQAFLDAHLVKDPAAVLRLYSRRPDVVFIAPNGTINRGHAAITGSFNLLFPNVESMRGEVREVTYHRVSDSVVATAGIEVFQRKLRNGTSDERTVAWTDVRVREDGEWRYLFRHSHWPVTVGPPLASPPAVRPAGAPPSRVRTP